MSIVVSAHFSSWLALLFLIALSFLGARFSLFGALTFSSMAFSVHQLLVIWKCSWLGLCERWRLESPVLGTVGYNLCATEGINEAKESKAVYGCWQCSLYSQACLHYELNIFTYPSDCLFVLAGAAAARPRLDIDLSSTVQLSTAFPSPSICQSIMYVLLLHSFTFFIFHFPSVSVSCVCADTVPNEPYFILSSVVLKMVALSQCIRHEMGAIVGI